MSTFDIQLLTTEQLLKELCGRFESAIFVGQKGYDDDTKVSKACLWRYRGNPFMCLGLASTLESILNEDIATHTSHAEPDSL